MDSSVQPVVSDVCDSNPISWNKCCLCEEDTREKLTCPAEHKNGGQGYKTLAQNLPQFNAIGELPLHISLTRLEEGKGLEETFYERKAKYHHTCYLRFNDKNLQRAQARVQKKGTEAKETEDDVDSSKGTKRNISESNDIPEKKFTRMSSGIQNTKSEICTLCEEPEIPIDSLRKASSFGLDEHIRQVAMDVQDQKLIAKLSEGEH